VYHSIYDSFDWYTRFSDKDFSKGKALAQVMTTALLRMADSSVLPFEFTQVAKAVQGYLADLSKRKELKLSDLHAELGKLQSAAETYERTYRKAIGHSSAQPKLNRLLIASEQALLNETGLPKRPFYKHQLMAPGLYTGYSPKTLPGIREAAEAQQWDEANEQTKNVLAALAALRANLEAAADLLSQ
jgi:N-acetylated-alpha-linked acidic dipeptidase